MIEDAPAESEAASTSRRSIFFGVIAGLIILAAGALLVSKVLQDDTEPEVAIDGSVVLDRVELATLIDTGNGGSITVHLVLDPANVGESSVEVRLDPNDLAKELDPVAAKTLTLTSLNDVTAPAMEFAWQDATVTIPAAGWWEIDVPVQWAKEGAGVARFFVLAPDPNVHGSDAPATPLAVSEAVLLYDRGLAAMTGLMSVRYTQLQGDGQGLAAQSFHAVDLTDPHNPSYLINVPGGTQAIGIGEESWIKIGDGPWELREGVGWVQPSQWGLEYNGASGFTTGGTEVINGEETRVLAFSTPEIEGQAASWYLWWVGVDTGMVHREVMISRGHYMRNEFSDFDQPLGIEAPREYVTPAPQS